MHLRRTGARANEKCLSLMRDISSHHFNSPHAISLTLIRDQHVGDIDALPFQAEDMGEDSITPSRTQIFLRTHGYSYACKTLLYGMRFT